MSTPSTNVLPSFLKPLEDLALREGSTRALGVVRIGLVLILWSRWGRGLSLFRHIEADWWLLALMFWASTIPLLLGWKTRFFSAMTGVTIVGLVVYLGGIREFEPYTHHHTTLLAILSCLMAFTPCGRSFSLDRWFAVKDARAKGLPLPLEQGPQWATWIILFQISSVYIFSSIDKLHIGWLSGERMEAIVIYYYFHSIRPDWPGFSTLMMLSGSGAVVLELSLAVGLWSRRLRPFLLPIGIAFHLVIYVTLPVNTFSATMVLFYLLFIPPAAVHTFIETLVAKPPAPSNRPTDVDPGSDVI